MDTGLTETAAVVAAPGDHKYVSPLPLGVDVKVALEPVQRSDEDGEIAAVGAAFTTIATSFERTVVGPLEQVTANT